MIKKAEEIQAKQSLENENLNFSKTGYSNSRLDAHTVCISDPKLKIGDLILSINEVPVKTEKDFNNERAKLWSNLSNFLLKRSLWKFWPD